MENLLKEGAGTEYYPKVEALKMARMMLEAAMACARMGLMDHAYTFYEDSKKWKLEFDRLSC